MSETAGARKITSEIEAELTRREAAPEGLGSILNEQVLGAHAGEVSRSWKVLSAWRSVNGDAERAHTTGVFVEQPRRAGELPGLVVYVDTKACEVDFRANAEIYLARLDAAGLRFSRITFRQDRRARTKQSAAQTFSPKKEPPRPLPELSAEEEAEVDALVASLPDSLKASVSRAMRMSLRREKQKSS